MFLNNVRRSLKAYEFSIKRGKLTQEVFLREIFNHNNKEPRDKAISKGLYKKTALAVEVKKSISILHIRKNHCKGGKSIYKEVKGVESAIDKKKVMLMKEILNKRGGSNVMHVG